MGARLLGNIVKHLESTLVCGTSASHCTTSDTEESCISSGLVKETGKGLLTHV